MRYREAFVWVTAFLTIPSAAFAQGSGFEIKAVTGYSLGLDDNPPDHWLTGVAARLPLTRRVGIEPEVLWADGFGRRYRYDERAFLVGVNAMFEFGNVWRLAPYMVAGVGLTQYRATVPNERYYFDPTLPETRIDKDAGMNMSLGVGTRLLLGKGVFLAPEVRVGYVPMGRATIGLGYRW